MDRSLRIWVICVGLIVAIGPLSIDMYLPSFPALQVYFSTDAASVQSTLSFFFIGLAIGQLIYGPIADRYGRRTPFLFGLLRSEERRVGQECVGPWRSRWSPDH